MAFALPFLEEKQPFVVQFLEQVTNLTEKEKPKIEKVIIFIVADGSRVKNVADDLASLKKFPFFPPSKKKTIPPPPPKIGDAEAAEVLKLLIEHRESLLEAIEEEGLNGKGEGESKKMRKEGELRLTITKKKK